MSAKLRDQAKLIKSSFDKQEEFTPVNNFIVWTGLLCTKSVASRYLFFPNLAAFGCGLVS